VFEDVAGSSAALALAKKGARVVVCEAQTVGHAASGRNGGMCNNGFAQDYAVMSAKLGAELANRLYRSFDAGVGTVERLVREEAIHCSFVRTGKLKLAAKPAHFDKLVRTQALLAAQADPHTRMVSRAELPAELGSQRYFGGMRARARGCHAAAVAIRTAVSADVPQALAQPASRWPGRHSWPP
jgi:glycine/D-amino acid oxidase-like deaminating enzyme